MSSTAGLLTDIAGQYALERSARNGGIAMTRELATDGRLCYRLTVDVPDYEEERSVSIEFAPSHRNPPAVFVDGSVCLRHRWSDVSLCMWDPDGPESERWFLADGIPELVQHIRIHAYCEAKCRDGEPWPKLEMPGQHPRKRECPSCRGRGW